MPISQNKSGQIILDANLNIVQYFNPAVDNAYDFPQKNIEELRNSDTVIDLIYKHLLTNIVANNFEPFLKKIPMKEQRQLIASVSCAYINNQSLIIIHFEIHSINFRKRFLDNLLENIPCYIYWKDINSVYLGCNLKFAQAAGGLQPSAIIGKTDYDLAWGKSEADLFRAGDLEVLSGVEKLNFEEPQKQADGTTRTVLASKVPVYSEEDEIIGLLGIYTDITDKKVKEQLMVENNLQTNQINLFKHLSATIAHELRTPLASIRNFASSIESYLPELIDTYLIAKQAKLEIPVIYSDVLESLKYACQEIKAEVYSANLFIDMMLANIRDEKFIGEKQDVLDIADIIQKAFDNYPFKAKEKYILHLELSDSFKIQGNEKLVSHLLFNLINNALYYIAAVGKGEIFVWLSSRKNKNILHFKDTGKGIAKEVLPHIFEKFFSDKHHGTGVGLSFCQMVMSSMNGNISCHSEEGKYTEFELNFPKITESN